MTPLRTPAYTLGALAAFAANSVLNRVALGGATIDPTSYCAIRLLSGAVTLLLILTFSGGLGRARSPGSWASATMLFVYAITFSFAYLSLDTGTGALILFGTVQATMIVSALRSGERPGLPEWAGLGLALGGLVYLVFPGLSAPSPVGSALMVAAGIGWGVYSLRGRGSMAPLADTTFNFLRTVPLALLASLLMLREIDVSAKGVFLACVSGSLASGVGYVIWYAALRGMSATRAATVQLAVPVLAAAGGVVFLAEAISMRLLLASVLILGGVGLAVTRWKRAPLGRQT